MKRHSLRRAWHGTLVGALSAQDTDPGDTLHFVLASGVGGTHNAQFSIVGNQVRLVGRGFHHPTRKGTAE